MNLVTKFENMIAEFYGSRYAVATDCCTHAIELSLRLRETKNNFSPKCPKHTYLSVPMTFMKLGMYFFFEDIMWTDYYNITHTDIIDAAVYWKENGYVSGSFMCLSFQHKKHLSLGRGGMILTDDRQAAIQLRKMSYDGRSPNVPWAEQEIDTMGYHYYMTPETASLGIEKFSEAVKETPRQWSWKDYPDISLMKVFNAK